MPAPTVPGLLGYVDIPAALSAGRLWQDAAGTAPATADGHPVRRVVGELGEVYVAAQPWTLKLVPQIQGNAATGFVLQGGPQTVGSVGAVCAVSAGSPADSEFLAVGTSPRAVPVQYHGEYGVWDTVTMGTADRPTYHINGVATNAVAPGARHRMTATFLPPASGVVEVGELWSGTVAAWAVGQTQWTTSQRAAVDAALAGVS